MASRGRGRARRTPGTCTRRARRWSARSPWRARRSGTWPAAGRPTFRIPDRSFWDPRQPYTAVSTVYPASFGSKSCLLDSQGRDLTPRLVVGVVFLEVLRLLEGVFRFGLCLTKPLAGLLLFAQELSFAIGLAHAD